MKTYLQKHDKIKYSDHWSTPKEMYKHYVNKLGYYDPCPLFADFFEMIVEDDYGDLFINPPYSNIKKWVTFAINYHRYFSDNVVNNKVVLLIPSRTDTKYFHELLEYGVELEFIKGRLKFGNSKYGAPFPSVLVHLRGGLGEAE